MDGYRYSLVKSTTTEFEIAGNPVPGVTGTETGNLKFAGQTYGVTFTPTPGAEAGQRQMWEQGFQAAARGFDSLAGLLPYVEQDNLFKQVRSYSSTAMTSQDVFQRLQGTDGRVSFHSAGGVLVGMGDGSVRVALSDVWNSLARSFQLGANRENWMALPGISSKNAVASDPTLFSLGTLRTLTIGMVADPRLEGLLLPAVDSATRAQTAGDLRGKAEALNTFSKSVDGGVVKGQITADAGQTLKSIAKTLY